MNVMARGNCETLSCIFCGLETKNGLQGLADTSLDCVVDVVI